MRGFFACMNLFVGSMLLLVMADNLVLMYLGWEGVGMCSYLLIGFWYESPANCQAANKAFLVTRIGDTAMLIGLFLLFKQLGTLSIPGIIEKAPEHFAQDDQLKSESTESLTEINPQINKEVQEEINIVQ